MLFRSALELTAAQGDHVWCRHCISVLSSCGFVVFCLNVLVLIFLEVSMSVEKNLYMQDITEILNESAV